MGNCEKTLILENLELSTNVIYDSIGVSKLGEVNLTKIINNNFQRPFFLGELYKSH
jgi:hypothetical protein